MSFADELAVDAAGILGGEAAEVVEYRALGAAPGLEVLGLVEFGRGQGIGTVAGEVVEQGGSRMAVERAVIVVPRGDAGVGAIALRVDRIVARGVVFTVEKIWSIDSVSATLECVVETADRVRRGDRVGG